MKRFPIPDKPLQTKAELREHIESLVFNAMKWLRVDGYVFHVLFPGDANHREHSDASLTIRVEYPYKKFRISIQQDSIDKMKSEPLSNEAFWGNVESSALHEVIHILLWRLGEYAERRFTTQNDIDDAIEEATDHFTHLIHNYMEEHRESERGKKSTPKRAKRKRSARVKP